MATVSKAELIKLQKTLKTDYAIGNKIGITRQAVYQLRKKYEIPSRWAKNDERNEKIKALYSKGITGKNISKNMGLSLVHTYRIIHEYGKKKSAKKKKS